MDKMSEMFEMFRLIGEDLYRRGLIDSHGGSISVRSGERIFINSRDCMLAHLKTEDIVEVGIEPSESDSKASRELQVHRAIYKETAYTAIVEAHPPKAIILSVNESKIIPQDAKGALFIKSVPVVKVRDKIGSDEVSRLLPPIYRSDYVIAVVKDYASFAVGKTLEEALKYTTCLEQSCEILLYLKLLERKEIKAPEPAQRRRAIPPSIGVMDRERDKRRFHR